MIPPDRDLRSLGEFPLIARLARALARTGAAPRAGSVTLSIGDDAAVLDLAPGRRLVATIDAVIEEVHFRRAWSRPEDLGWKALAVNVSDLGAMGARPLACLVTLGAPPDLPVRWIERLYAGFADCARAYGCPVVGGDTVRSPSAVVLSVAALGSVPADREVTRAGARRGDLVCVTGVLGDSGAGLALLQRGGKVARRYRALERWHLRPEPPVASGALLAEAGLATAMMDLSDGLASDLRHIVKRSGVGARVYADRLPISDAARRGAQELGIDPLDWALHGGEDYQLLFSVPPERFAEVPPLLAPLGVTATCIGEMHGKRATLVGRDGEAAPLVQRGFSHFRPGP